MVKMKLDQLKKLEGNPRKITKEDMERLKKSIKKFGVIEGRPFLVSKRTGENIIIGGNQRYEACKSLGIQEVPVYIFEKITEEEEREIIIRDNVNNGEWDYDILANEWNTEQLHEWGVDISFTEENAEEENPYSDKIETPVYEITGKMPNIALLCDTEKSKKLIEKIKNANITEEQKQFLLLSAHRHNIFDFSNIAEYYAHQNGEMKNLMEESALVIIDFDKAIENGLVRMTKEINELFNT